MIKLVIDDQEVVMDSGFSTDIVRENPLITSAGDYSYDIDVDLRVPRNRRIYKDFQRLNTLSSFSNRKAELLDNEKILARGTEAVLSIEENRAKIQVLSNNSELNYIFDETRSIRELDFGTVTTKTTTLAAKVSKHLYGETVDGIVVKEAYPLVFREDFTGFGSEASVFNGLSGDESATDIAFDDVDDLRPMPYLLYYIDKLVEILGYTMGTCHIDRNKYKRLLVIHGYDTLEYAKMLPDWTVSQFVSEVEKFFGVVFLVDSIRKVIDIVSVDAFYQTAGCEYIAREDVLDEHEVNFEVESEEFQTSYQNVGYKLPSSEYWKFASIDEEVDRRCRREESPSGADYDPKDMVIYYDHRRQVEWILCEKGDDDSYGRLVNFFAPSVKDDDATRTVLSITPVKMNCSLRIGDHGTYIFAGPVPEYYEDKGATLSEAIRGGVAESASDRMQVAFYLGFCHFRGPSGERDVFSFGTTQCMTSRYLQVSESSIWWTFTAEDSADISRNLILELRGEQGRCANELNIGSFIDGTRQFKVRFVTTSFLDPRRKFVIANRLFYCQQLRYKMENGKMSEIVEGVFYPAKPDQEVAPQSELDAYLGQIQGAEKTLRVWGYADESEPFESGGRMMGSFDSRDNGYSENQMSLSIYGDDTLYPHYYMYAALSESAGTYALSSAKVSRFVNGTKVSETANAQLGGTSILCDSSPLVGLAVGNEITYVVEGITQNQTSVYGYVKLRVVV